MDNEELREENIRLRKALHLAQLSNGGLMARVRALEHRARKRMEMINNLKRKYKNVKADLATALKVVNEQIKEIHKYDHITVHLHSVEGGARPDVAEAQGANGD